MARWNLRRAAERRGARAGASTPSERRAGCELADALVDGYDPATGLYEQFAGFHALEPLLIAEVAPSRPVAADLLLGRERVGRSQVVKQADVLMLAPPRPRRGRARTRSSRTSRFYEPRTAHGSSLSPGRARRPDRPRRPARRGARVARLTAPDRPRRPHRGDRGRAPSWRDGQRLAGAGLGVRGGPCGGRRARVDPRLPERWKGLRLRLRYRGASLGLELEAGVARLTTDRPIKLALGAATEPIGVAEGTALWELPEPELETAR